MCLTMYTLLVINSRGGGDTHTYTHMNACKVTSQTKALLETQGAHKLPRFLLANCFL